MEYLLDLNATQAAIRAGYSKKTAQQMGAENLSKPVIKDAISKAKAIRAGRLEVTQDSILQKIVETIERCSQATPVLDAKGQQVFTKTATGELAAAFVFDPQAVLKGTDQLAKHVGLYEADNRQKNPIQEMSMEALNRFIERKAKEVGVTLH